MSETSSTESETRRQATLGAAAAGVGYVTWDLSVIYYRQLALVSPFEILAHRALWSLLLIIVCIVGFRRVAQLTALLRDRGALTMLSITATIIGSNWLVFIWAVNSGRILETGLGYFINPLMSVLAGVVLLGERLSRAQMVAMALAAAGVIYFTFALGFVPRISLFLAVSFAGYGFLKKIIRVEALEGLLVEVAIIAPFGIAHLIWEATHAGTSFVHDGLYTDVLLVLTGPMTTIPLLLFTFGAQRIRLTTLGLMQYLVPSTSFAIAVWLYGEPLEHRKIVTFVMIWTGLAIFTADTWRKERELRRVMPSRA